MFKKKKKTILLYDVNICSIPTAERRPKKVNGDASLKVVG